MASLPKGGKPHIRMQTDKPSNKVVEKVVPKRPPVSEGTYEFPKNKGGG